jgi:hypothetical protein
MKKHLELLGEKGGWLLDHKCKVSKEFLHVPGRDYLDRVWIPSDRSPQVLCSLQRIFNHGRLSNTGYLSIFQLIKELNILQDWHLLLIPFILTGNLL